MKNKNNLIRSILTGLLRSFFILQLNLLQFFNKTLPIFLREIINSITTAEYNVNVKTRTEKEK